MAATRHIFGAASVPASLAVRQIPFATKLNRQSFCPRPSEDRIFDKSASRAGLNEPGHDDTDSGLPSGVAHDDSRPTWLTGGRLPKKRASYVRLPVNQTSRRYPSRVPVALAKYGRLKSSVSLVS